VIKPALELTPSDDKAPAFPIIMQITCRNAKLRTKYVKITHGIPTEHKKVAEKSTVTIMLQTLMD